MGQPELPLPSDVTFGLSLLHITVPVRKSSLLPGPQSGVFLEEGDGMTPVSQGALAVQAIRKPLEVQCVLAICPDHTNGALVHRRGPSPSAVGAEEELPNKDAVVRKVGEKEPPRLSLDCLWRRTHCLGTRFSQGIMARCHGLRAQAEFGLGVPESNRETLSAIPLPHYGAWGLLSRVGVCHQLGSDSRVYTPH